MCKKCSTPNHIPCGCPTQVDSCKTKKATHQHYAEDVFLCKNRSKNLFEKYNLSIEMNMAELFHQLLCIVDGQSKSIEQYKEALTNSNSERKIYFQQITDPLPSGKKDSDGRAYTEFDIIIVNDTGDSSGTDPKATYYYTGLKWVAGWK